MLQEMNRRSFLKSIATICGVAVVCPGELLRDEPEWMKYAKTWDKLLKDKPHPAQRVYMINHPIFIKARQQGFANSTFHIMHNFGGRRSGYIITRPT